MSGKIRIAGGGLSGLATAVHLARRGFEVEVFDRHRGGGGRFAGGWQVLENGSCELDALDELRGMGLEPDFATVPATRALFLDGFGGAHEVASEAPYAYFVRRGGPDGSMDAWLRSLALTAGVALHEGVPAPADAEVVATGPRQADGVARELVFASDLADTVAVLFDPAITPTGYAYLFCLGGHGTFGVAQVRRLAGLPRARELAWRRFREALGEFAVRDGREHGQFMNFSLPRPPARVRRALVRRRGGRRAGLPLRARQPPGAAHGRPGGGGDRRALGRAGVCGVGRAADADDGRGALPLRTARAPLVRRVLPAGEPHRFPRLAAAAAAARTPPRTHWRAW